MTNEANIFYKPLRRVSISDENQTKISEKSIFDSNNMHIVAMTFDEPAKIAKSPGLMVCGSRFIFRTNKYMFTLNIRFLIKEMDCGRQKTNYKKIEASKYGYKRFWFQLSYEW